MDRDTYPFCVQLVASDEVLMSSYFPIAPFVPRKSDVIIKDLEKFTVLEVQITYLIPSGMNFVVYLERVV